MAKLKVYREQVNAVDRRNEPAMKEYIRKAHPLRGTITLPGDKSISHRAIMFSALANGLSEIDGLSLGHDVKSTIACLKQLGITIKSKDNIIQVYGRGMLGLQKPKSTLNVGNSSTTMQLLSGILSGQNFSSEITGDDSLTKQSMRRIIEPLRAMEADIIGHDQYFAPLIIHGHILANGSHELEVSSAQVKSCLLLAGMYAQGETKIIESIKSRDHSERLLSYMGANISIKDKSVSIEGFPRLTPTRIYVPGDVSLAAFFVVATLLIKNSELIIKNVGINSTRCGILDVLAQMGASIEYSNKKNQNYESSGDLTIRSSDLTGTTISNAISPRIIGELPILIVVATQARGRTFIENAIELSAKEIVKIGTMIDNLSRMGVRIEKRPEGIIIEGQQKLTGAELDCCGDHRVAMALAIAGLLAEGDTIIDNAECVDNSFPGFFFQLEDLCYD